MPRPTLEPGKLYQVKHPKGWIIAEYVKEIAAHSYKYHELFLEPTIRSGKEKTRHVPLSHCWKKIRHGDSAYSTNFSIEDRGMEVRPVTEEAVAEIIRLKSECIAAEVAFNNKKKELREFCE